MRRPPATVNPSATGPCGKRDGKRGLPPSFKGSDPFSRAVVCGQSRHRGFTLIEVLATLTFIAILLPVVMKGITLASAAALDARRRAEATALAQNQLAEMIATGSWQMPTLSGDFAPDWPDYKWTAEIIDWQGSWQPSVTGAALRQVQVRVTWTARGVEHSVALATLVYAGGS